MIKRNRTTFKEHLGLFLIELGAKIFFRHKKIEDKESRDTLTRKFNKMVEEVNKETLIGCQIESGGHGYDTPHAPIISDFTAASIRNVLVDARASLDPNCRQI